MIESVKAASDVYAPVSGEVIERNEQAIESPDLVNRSPYDEAWLVKVRMSNPSELESLMNADEYDAFAAEAVH